MLYSPSTGSSPAHSTPSLMVLWPMLASRAASSSTNEYLGRRNYGKIQTFFSTTIYFYISIAFVEWILSNDSWIFCSLDQFVNCLIIIICHFPFSFINSSAFIDLLGANKYSLFNIKCIKWFILTVRQINLGVKKGETHSLIDMNIPPNKWLTHAPFTCFKMELFVFIS